MNKRQHQQWEQLGATDPYWAVLTNPEKKDGKWQKEEFFRTGEGEILSVLKNLQRYGLSPDYDTALDYGCGVGRLSRALTNHFNEVIGVDMSNSMLEEAGKVNADKPNLRFIRNSGYNLQSIEDASVDFIYSNITLQHSTRNTQKAVIKEFCRVLKPGGALAFQTPSRHKFSNFKGILYWLAGNFLLNFLRRFKYGRNSLMDMYTLPRSSVEKLLEENSMQLVTAAPNGASGPFFLSFMYFVTKAPK